jgi:hypothetical protein
MSGKVGKKHDFCPRLSHFGPLLGHREYDDKAVFIEVFGRFWPVPPLGQFLSKVLKLGFLK